MQKRYQVFVSSTFEDLKVERQAAVEAILRAGHVPAGMELFTAGDKSQMDVIRRWIDQSDIFMLILGGRYGSIEPAGGLSYVETEFNYAREQGKPFFAVVISENGREAKVRAVGLSTIEQRYEAAYRAFRERVTSHLCAFFDDPNGVKLAVFETLPQIIATRQLVGWVSAKGVDTAPDVARELARLSLENQQLRRQVETLESRLKSEFGELGSFEQVLEMLKAEIITVPRTVTKGQEVKVSLSDVMVTFADDLARGVSNEARSSDFESFLFFKVASPLAAFGLVEHGKTPPSVLWQRLVLSKHGIRFITRAKMVRASNPQAAAPVSVPQNAPEKEPDTAVHSRPTSNAHKPVTKRDKSSIVKSKRPVRKNGTRQ